jgi:hypothetical protein
LDFALVVPRPFSNAATSSPPTGLFSFDGFVLCSLHEAVFSQTLQRAASAVGISAATHSAFSSHSTTAWMSGSQKAAAAAGAAAAAAASATKPREDRSAHGADRRDELTVLRTEMMTLRAEQAVMKEEQARMARMETKLARMKTKLATMNEELTALRPSNVGAAALLNMSTSSPGQSKEKKKTDDKVQLQLRPQNRQA